MAERKGFGELLDDELHEELEEVSQARKRLLELLRIARLQKLQQTGLLRIQKKPDWYLINLEAARLAC